MKPVPVHSKHADLVRPPFGDFHRNEIAILGTTCADIRELVTKITQRLGGQYKTAFVDADHKGNNETIGLQTHTALEYTDKISFTRTDFTEPPAAFKRRTLFNHLDLVFVNGNHFAGRMQVAVVDARKPLEHKMDKLTNVQLVLLRNEDGAVPAYLAEKAGTTPVVKWNETEAIVAVVEQVIKNSIPELNGLVLAGGKSTRMQRDKGLLQYHNENQRAHVLKMLEEFCDVSFVSCNAGQVETLAPGTPYITDTFLELGPVGGILSAFRYNPNAAWLTVACDLPYLSPATLRRLVDSRNTSKSATAFYDPKGVFPEPLITIWEPKSYLTLLEMLAQGYSCPRKALINTDVELLKAPDAAEFKNVNNPDEFDEVYRRLHPQTGAE